MNDLPESSSHSKKTKATRGCLFFFIFFTISLLIGGVIIYYGVILPQSTAITRVTVTSLAPETEVRDEPFSFENPTDALPDYRLDLIDATGHETLLWPLRNQSAAEGLTWDLIEPLHVEAIAELRLVEVDNSSSDRIAQGLLAGESTTFTQYRFDLTKEHNTDVGFEYFYKTPLGQMIRTALTFVFTLAFFLFALTLLFIRSWFRHQTHSLFTGLIDEIIKAIKPK